MITVVFAEKNKAAARIAEILSHGESRRTSSNDLPVYEFTRNGKKWKVMGLAGHITSYDFDDAYRDWKATDPASLLVANLQKSITKQNYAGAVMDLAKEADDLILACDYDREGENIGFEARDIAEKVRQVPVKRARFSSLSVKEVTAAFDNLVEPDMNLAMSAETRQILDLRMGAAFTRFLTLSVREKTRTEGILSIGPCQTPTCGFVYEREKAIRSFQPEDFWKIEALFESEGREFRGLHRRGNMRDRDEAAAVYRKLEGCREGKVMVRKVREQPLHPPYPLNTNEFLKRASGYFSISPEKALEIAEQLYLAGFISYPRTETNRYAEDHDFRAMLTALLKVGDYRDIAGRLLENEISPKNGKKDGHDHPPIHPIKASTRAAVGNAVRLPLAWEVYDMVVRHYLANLMKPALFEKTRLEIHIRDEPFDSKGSVLRDKGWMEVYPFETTVESLLPPVEEGETVDVKEIKNIKAETSPPKRLTEAELLTLMDKHGIGTKATAPSHIETNKKRGYFETKGKTLAMLDTGYTLMDALGSSVPIVIRPEIRARIEALIQDVEDGNKSMEGALDEGVGLIKQMYGKLALGKQDLVSRIAGTIRDTRLAEDKRNYIGTCDKCGRALTIRRTDKGRFVGCSGYPDCRNTYPLPRKGALNVVRSRECKKGSPAVMKVTGGKYYWAVGIGPCFACDMQKECYPPVVLGKCPQCGRDVILIETANSRFAGCSDRCGFTCSYPSKGRVTLRDEVCEECGWRIVRVKETGKEPRHFCINRRCSRKHRNLL